MDLKAVHEGVHRRRRKKRVGRGPGSKTGRTATRGNKGQYARTGDNPKLLKEGGQMPLFRRIAKRGFNNPFKPEVRAVNVGDLEMFDAGTVVTMEIMEAVGLAKVPHDQIKILGDGDLSKKLEVHAHAFSHMAKAKIEKAGGKCVVAVLPHRGPKIRNKMRPRPPKRPLS